MQERSVAWGMLRPRRGALIGAALLLIVAAVAPMRARAESAPYALFIADDQRFEIPVVLGSDKKSWVIGENGEGWSHEEAGWECTIGGTLNPDPSIAYGIAAIDLGAPSLFGFFFFTPIVPTGSPNTVTASIVGGLTDFTGDGIAIVPTIGGTLQRSYVTAPATSMGVDVGPGFAAGAGPPGSFYAYGPHVAGPMAGPGPGPWTGLGVDLTFGLSGGGDIAVLTGFASINAVPEPATLSLFGLGLGAIGALAFRRRR